MDEIDYEMSPLSSEDNSDKLSYSRMSMEEAEKAYANRKQIIKQMLQSRRSSLTPKSNQSSVQRNPAGRSNQSTPLNSRNSECNSRRMSQCSSSRMLNFDLSKVSSGEVNLPRRMQEQLKKKTSVGKSMTYTPHSYDTRQPLFERAVRWKKETQERASKQKEEQEKEALNQCTFKPKIRNASSERKVNYADIYKRQVKWKKVISHQHEETNLRNQLRELEECTFEPNTSNKPELPINPAGMYSRGIHWKQMVDEKMKKMEVENLHEIRGPPKKLAIKIKNENPESPFSSENLEERYSKLTNQLDNISKQIEATLNNSVY